MGMHVQSKVEALSEEPDRTQSDVSAPEHDRFTCELVELVKARFPIIQVVTYEEDRALAEIESIATRLKHRLLIWSTSRGVYGPTIDGEKTAKPNKFADADLAVALEFLEAVAEKQKNPLLMVLLDPYPYISEKSTNPIYRRKLRDVAINIRTKGYMANVLIISPTVTVPLELEKETTVLDFPLPAREEIHGIVHRIMHRLGETNIVKVGAQDGQLENALVDASLGLTVHEIESGLARGIVGDQRLDMDDVNKIIRQKQLIVRKSGILDFFDTKDMGVELIGGLGTLKQWLKTREAAFSEEGRGFGISPPKGVLLTGVPGCGKSLSAKCVAASWRLPLLRLDIGKIYSRWIGSSEEHVRAAIATTEAVAPCVLWIDEIEKGMPRNEGHVGDSGVSMRVFASFLTWLQEKTAPVFVFATANQLDLLAPEILRKGRFDEIFFVDLPTDEEREQIIRIHIKKVGRNPDDFPIDKLVRMSGEEAFGEGVRLSGSEIEAWVNEALIHALFRSKSEQLQPLLKLEDFSETIGRTTPLAKMRREEIHQMRQWAHSHALDASDSASSKEDQRKSARMPGGSRIALGG